MSWISPLYSKSKVGKAGVVLAKAQSISPEVLNAYDVLANWRSAHAYPMHCVLMRVRGNVPKIDASSLIVQRLKRVTSIVEKLKRESGMSLERMEDIGGCRVILKDIRNVRLLENVLTRPSSSAVLHRVRDYIAKPKKSGYRAVHIIYKYKGKKTPYQGLAVELQLRSKVQHSWATAVEVVGTFTKQALKASQGHQKWLDFFRYTGIEFAQLEHGISPKDIDLEENLKTAQFLAKHLDVSERLRAFAVSTKFLTEKKGASGYFLLSLDIEKSSIQVSSYGSNDLNRATERYSQLEKAAKGNEKKNIVLVAAADVHTLQKAYPNYFADTVEFAKNLEKAKIVIAKR